MNSVFFKKDFYLRFADGKICGFGGIKIFLSVTALLFFATFFCVATDYKWKGSSSGSWGYAGNWSIIAENGTESPASDWPKAGDCAKFDSEVTITDSVSAGKMNIFCRNIRLLQEQIHLLITSISMHRS